MNKKLVLVILLAALALYIGFAIANRNKLNKEYTNPEYQKYIAEYRDIVNSKVNQTINANEASDTYNLNYQSATTGGTTGNFEGPQVHLKAIKFCDEILTGKDQGTRLKHFDGVSAHFDPDHAYYGLPDVKISIKDVRLYEMEKGPLAEFLSFGTDKSPKPYKIYKKRIVSDSLGLKNKFFIMQLWLTEFEVNVDIRPDRDVPDFITAEERNTVQYPGYWYGSSQKWIKLKDLDKEFKDMRYGDLSFILEVIPDKSPIFLKTKDGVTSKPDFAIGAIYCNKAIIGNEPKVQRISTNVHAGMPLFLNNEYDFSKMNENLNNFSTNLESNADKIMAIKTNDENFIWSKPYYIKLFFNNLGTWRSGVFNQNQFHDQVNLSFLMPVFVVGSWDVIIPQEILPAWDPPKPFIKKITIRNFLPFWNLGFFGKMGSILLLVIILSLVLLKFVPGLPGAIKKIF